MKADLANDWQANERIERGMAFGYSLAIRWLRAHIAEAIQYRPRLQKQAKDWSVPRRWGSGACSEFCASHDRPAFGGRGAPGSNVTAAWLLKEVYVDG